MPQLVEKATIEQRIYIIRNRKVMLDSDLAALYAVKTKALKRAVRRNSIRFPPDFMFRLSAGEAANLRCQIGTSSWGGHRYRPFAFTEQGIAMLSSVLRGDRAALVNIAIMRTFIRLNRMLMDNKKLAAKLAEHDARLTDHDERISNLFDAIQEIMEPPLKPRPRIGFNPPEEAQ